MTLSLIAAVARKGVIGLNGDIPWHIPEDMAYFRRITMGHRVIMGKNTWKSLPCILHGRQSVIISSKIFEVGGIGVICRSVEEALSLPQWGGHEEVFCIGGAKLYKAMLPLANKLYLTEICKEFSGDTFFPNFEEKEWKLMHSELGHKMQEVGFYYYFSVYERKI